MTHPPTRQLPGTQLPPCPRTLRIELAYALRGLALAAIVASTPLILLLALMQSFGFDPAIAAVTAISALFLLAVTRHAFLWGIKQAIHLHPNKIVFDGITCTQEFSFASAKEWRIDDDNGYWKIGSTLNPAIKFVPKAAYPQLKYVAQRFYAGVAALEARGRRRMPLRWNTHDPRRSMRAAMPWLRVTKTRRRHGHRCLRGF